MSRLVNKLTIAVVTLGVVSSAVSDALACGGVGIGRVVIATRPVRHVPVVVVQGQPGFQYAPGYDPATQGYVPANAYPSGTSYVNGGSQVESQPQQAYPQGYTNNGVQVTGNGNVFSQGNGNVINQQGNGNYANVANYQGQNTNQMSQGAPNGQPISANGQNQMQQGGQQLRANGAVAPTNGGMPNGQGQVNNGQMQANNAPVQNGQAMGQPVGNGQAAAAKPVNNPAPINNVGSANSAQMAALQALMATDEQSAAAPASNAGLPVGDWTAKVSGTASVHLSLQANGGFRWSAENNGKSSAFEGTYTIENGALTLIRSTDSQKLEGTINMSQDGFNFRLNGAKDAGLTFNRS